MGKTFRYSIFFIPLFILSFSIILLPQQSYAIERKFGIGVKAGINKLEGDWKEPQLNPVGVICVHYALNPFFSLAGEIGYSSMKSKSDAERIEFAHVHSKDLKIQTIPCELSMRVNFLPFSRFNPFTTLAVGVVQWKASDRNATLQRNGKEQKAADAVFATGGGIEFRFADGLGVELGSNFSLTTTDFLDQIDNGDEKDGILSVWTGFNYYFASVDRDDQDADGIPRELDLDPDRAEDINGYMDHDGFPENGLLDPMNQKAPIVLHHPIFKAEAQRNFKLRAKIITSAPLRTAAILYRTYGHKNWGVVQLQQKLGNNYFGQIIGDNIDVTGFEYCIVAVDQRVKGVGYSGLPACPIKVSVLRNGSSWRAFGGLASALSWGAASYIVLRKQTN